ncbi:hypothetical protein [Phenylobacterium sp.]|jgi:hypothetical protein|uniref:hypothetical protein n=1 Tax=Phenylobacterium sp. TaxID=1871053 RepID=UPI002F3EEB57
MSVEDKRLDRQQAYQHFHIGIYLSLATAIMGASFFSGDKVADLVWWLKLLLFLSILLLLFAGACGGMVASQIPRVTSHNDLQTKRHGFSLPGQDSRGRWPNLDGKTWEAWEHFYFWAAMIVLVAFTGAFLGCPKATSPHQREVIPVSVTSKEFEVRLAPSTIRSSADGPPPAASRGR